MWRRDEEPVEKPTPRAEPPRLERTAPAMSAGERATIGRSIAIRGDVTGDEDLLIQGRVEGSVNLKEHAVTVGPDGEVKASIVGRVVTVEGRVEGDLTADEQVSLQKSAWVEGNITAPRVVLEDGAHFLGTVDMGKIADRGRKPGSPVQKPGEVGRSEPAKPVGTIGGPDGKRAADSAVKAGT